MFWSKITGSTVAYFILNTCNTQKWNMRVDFIGTSLVLIEISWHYLLLRMQVKEASFSHLLPHTERLWKPVLCCHHLLSPILFRPLWSFPWEAWLLPPWNNYWCVLPKVCMYVCMYRAELARSFGLSLTSFCSRFVPAQRILGAVCDQQSWQRKGVACQFMQGASQDHRSQHSLQRGWDFSWWQCHYHWYAISKMINSCDRMSLFASCCLLFSSSSMINIAWADGTIRAYYPESGKPMYTIHNAHGKVGTTHFIWHTQLCYFPVS